MLKRLFSQITLLTMVLMLSGCSSKEEELQKSIDKQIAATTASIQNLETAIKGGKVRNALILKQYSDSLAKQKPELAQLGG